MFQKVLVPLDGSTVAERALPLALALLPPTGGKLYLLRAIALDTMFVTNNHIWGNYALIWPDQSLQLSHEKATKYLHTLQTDTLTPSVQAQTTVAEGEAAEVIVDMARSEGMDLIVMSSHGYSGFSRWIMGSVAERVLHQAPCPVLVARSIATPRHILIPLDGSPLSAKVLPVAFGLAKRLGCQVTLLRSVAALADPQLNHSVEIENGNGVGAGLAPVDKALWHESEDYLHAQASMYYGYAPQIKTVVSWHTQPAHSILDYVQTHAIDLIAMSTHGHSGLRRWVYGSVTDKVLRAANTCSMLVVRPD